MGEVYRARDTKLDRDVAIKLLPELFADDPERLAKFEREAKTLASLNHPHIAQVYAIEGRALVMEPPTITTPAMTMQGVILGTAAYMSPEQAKGRPVDRRADIWAFGAVLYELLTGKRAFGGDDVSETLASVLRSDPDWARLPADVPARIRQVLRSCLQRDAKQRLGDMQSVRLALDGAFETAPLVATSADEREAQFSPDGKWIAYQSDETTRFEVYVQAFPGPGGKAQISVNGGAQVRWRNDGKELFFIDPAGTLMAASIRLDEGRLAVERGTPTPLFPTRIAGGQLPTTFKQQYDVSKDGQRFLVNTLPGGDTPAPITLVLNWTPPAPK
jgi:hypothetical protein